ncbi:uncharacterized protein BX663DRAFT_502411 [Cokeromyces recurvatus]|uniref:uncharacterized protein n=1 Tax=Cokeromyces recurvatus TaxID=90255 RepID=UPI00221F14A9|nr:uncharacterized protein BX663DRAFT_502411 [Cokeromyces recurvatus]KAI7905305.1 hypothetical protein BX663DRAFT_502411 [Cokeromyces recurvatus]
MGNSLFCNFLQIAKFYSLRFNNKFLILSINQSIDKHIHEYSINNFTNLHLVSLI